MPSQFGGIAVDEAPSGGSQFGGIPVEENQTQQSPSFLGGMWENFKNAGQSASDLLSGNYSDFGNNPEGPKTAALADKLFPPGYQGGAMEAFNNLRHNVSPNDVFGALNEKFGASPEGKALSVIGGVVPEFNAVSTLINQDVNPFIEKHTGIGPETLQTMELGLPALAGARTIAKGGEFPETPSVQMAKNAIQPRLASLMADERGTPHVAPTFTPEDIKAASQNAYQQMRDSGATLNQSGIGKVTYGIGKSLDDSGMMNPALHGDTMAVVDALNKDAASGSMDLEKLDQYRQLLNQVVSKNTTKLEGMNPDAYKAQTAINALDDAVDSLNQQHINNPQAIESLNNARSLYSAQARMNTMQRIVDNAQYSDNPATAIKTGFKNLSKQLAVNPRGYSPEEIAAINNAAKTGIVTGALKLVGSRLSPLIMGGAGYATGGPLGAALTGATDYMLSGAARAGANALQAGRAQNAIDMISQRPAVQQSLNPNYTPPTAASPSAPLSTNPTSALLGGTMEQRQPATAPLSDQNMQELQKMQQSLPQPAPKPTASTQANNFFAKEAKAESSNNPNAQSKTSSASGLFGFTNRTWADMVRRYGKQTGINLGDKNNPQSQATMARLLAQDNIKSLQTSLGRMPTKPEVYYAHVFGAEGADKLIKAAPDKQAIMLFPRNVIDANHSLFFEKGKPRTVGEVEQILARKVA